ncbi:MAG: ABC transporter permease [Vicinamibacterales bacterium]
MTGALKDLVHSWRGLKRQPGFLIAAWLTLTVGIGANTTVFSLVNGIHFRPMPFGDRSDRLVTMHPTTPKFTQEPDWGSAEISYRDLLDFRSAPSVEGIGAHFRRSFVLSGDQANAERVLGGSVTPDLFPLLGIEPILGRQFLPEEAAPPGLERSVMLTHRLWQQRYGGDPSIVGKTIIVNEGARTVVGVLPPGFQFPVRDAIYAPLRWDDDAARSNRNVNAVALMRPGSHIDETRAQMSAIARHLEELYPDTNRGFGVMVVPIRESYLGARVGTMAAVFMTAVGFVLLIVCANLANLMLVRGAARQREVAVRAAMGAGRGRLVWTSLCESVWLAAPGAALGLLASQWVLDALLRTIPQEVPYWVRFDLDPRVAAFTVGVATFTAIAVGLLPSIRSATPDLVTNLKEAGRELSLGPGGQRLQATLAVVQVALCFGLLVGANLMVRSFLAMRSADLGFDDRPLLSARAYLAGKAYDDPIERSRFFRQAAGTLAEMPGAVAAAAITGIPGDDGGGLRRLVIDGRTSESDEIRIEALGMTEDFFTVLGLPITEGRTFTPTEVENPYADVALINRSLARRLWPNESALDRRLGFRDGQAIAWFRVIGVVPDVHYEEIGNATDESRLNVYIPYGRDGSRSMALLVRAAGDPQTLVAPARDALHRLNPGFPVTRLMSMSDLRRLTSWEQEFFGDMMGVFAAMALGLACLGVYALIAYSVGHRSREIGVRLALGARPRDVVTMLLSQNAKVGGAGLLAGVMLGILVARGLTRALYGVSTDGWLFVSMGIPLALAIVLATWLPARRAALVDPMVSLRDE